MTVNSLIQTTMHNGRIHGHALITDTASPATGSLQSSTPVHNNAWAVSGIFETEKQAAIALQAYLGITGTVWGIDDVTTDDTSTEVHFSKPKLNDKVQFKLRRLT